MPAGIHATSKHPNLTCDTKFFLDAFIAKGGPPLYTLSYRDARKFLLDVQSGVASRPDADIDDITLPVGPTGGVDVRIVRPKGVSGKLPVLFYTHGGGWVTGNRHTHDRLVRELAQRTGAAVVFPEYTPSPEAQYPTPPEQAYAVLLEITRHAGGYGLDPDKLVLCGDGAGGNMATVLALWAKERGGPKALLQLLFYPVTDARMDSSSYKTFADGPWLTRIAMEWFWDAYLPDNGARNDAAVSPLQASYDRLTGLPPALIITAENDVLRDEGEAYAARLDEAGVRSAAICFTGTHHDFVMLDALAATAPARTAMHVASAVIKKAFAGFPDKCG